MKITIKERPSYFYPTPEPIHPENKIISLYIKSHELKYYKDVEENKKGNLIQTGRTMFSVIEIHEYTDRDCQNENTIFIEYNPEFLSHMWKIFLNIGFRTGYDMCSKIYNK